MKGRRAKSVAAAASVYNTIQGVRGFVGWRLLSACPLVRLDPRVVGAEGVFENSKDGSLGVERIRRVLVLVLVLVMLVLVLVLAYAVPRCCC